MNVQSLIVNIQILIFLLLVNGENQNTKLAWILAGEVPLYVAACWNPLEVQEAAKVLSL